METIKPVRRLSGLALLPLIWVPGVLLLLSLKFLNGSGWFDRNGDTWSMLFIIANAFFSLFVAFGLIRPLSVVGFRRSVRAVAAVILGIVLACVGYYSTIFLMIFVIGVA